MKLGYKNFVMNKCMYSFCFFNTEIEGFVHKIFLFFFFFKKKEI